MTGMEDEMPTQDIVYEVIDTVFGLPTLMDEDECKKFQNLLEDED